MLPRQSWFMPPLSHRPWLSQRRYHRRGFRAKFQSFVENKCCLPNGKRENSMSSKLKTSSSATAKHILGHNNVICTITTCRVPSSSAPSAILANWPHTIDSTTDWYRRWDASLGSSPISHQVFYPSSCWTIMFQKRPKHYHLSIMMKCATAWRAWCYVCTLRRISWLKLRRLTGYLGSSSPLEEGECGTDQCRSLPRILATMCFLPGYD